MMIPVGTDLTRRSSAYQPIPAVGMTMGGMPLMMQEMYGGQGVGEDGGLMVVEDVGSCAVEGSTTTTTTDVEEEDSSVFLHRVVQYRQQQHQQPLQPLPSVLARQQQPMEAPNSSMMGMMMVEPTVEDWIVTNAGGSTAAAAVAAPWKLQPCLEEFSLMGQAGVRDNRKKRRVQEDVVDDKAAIQKQKRMIKNRESAARSRERKQIYIEDLERVSRQLKEENGRLERQLEVERKRLKKLQEMESKCRWLLDSPMEERRCPPRRHRRSRTF